MTITDIAVIAVVAVIIGLAALYVYKAKKSGQKCIGCPHSKSCSSAKEHKGCSRGCKN